MRALCCWTQPGATPTGASIPKSTATPSSSREGGEIVATGDPGVSTICEIYGNAILHNVDNTIRGGNLRLGYNTLYLTNDGLILADTPGLLQIDPGSGLFGCTNKGTLRADGGTLSSAKRRLQQQRRCR